MSELGLFVATPGTSLPENKLDFDSRRKHLLVDLNITPKHFDVIHLTGTNITSPGGSVETSEILFSIPHKLPYIPKIETYIFVSGDFNLYAGSGSYYRTFYPYSGSGGISDIVRGEVDATNYYIKHSITALGGAATSTAASSPLEIKYYIFSNKGTY